MYRWSACPGSVRLSDGVPNHSSAYAEEGTLAHEYAAMWLEGQEPYAPDAPDDMLPAVQVYVETIQEDREPGDILLVEKSFDLSEIVEGAFGTSDAILFKPKAGKMICYDYKHGAGIPVEVVENKQALYYGLGAMLSNKDWEVETVELVIVQPRCEHPAGPVRRWEVDSFRLLDFAGELEEAAKRTLDPNAPLNEGEWCRFCPAATNCPKMNESALALADEVFAPEEGYDPERLARQLNFIPVVEAWISQVREFAYQEAVHGRIPPGFKLVAKQARRKWKSEDEVISWCEENGIGEAVRNAPQKLKSPAQLEKAVHKSKRDELSELVIKSSSGEYLVSEDDPRPAVELLSIFD